MEELTDLPDGARELLADLEDGGPRRLGDYSAADASPLLARGLADTTVDQLVVTDKGRWALCLIDGRPRVIFTPPPPGFDRGSS